MKKLRWLTFSLILTSFLTVSCSKYEDQSELIKVDEPEASASLKSMSLLQQTAFSAMLEQGLSQVVYFADTNSKGTTRDGTHLPSGPQGFILTEGSFPYFTSFGGFAASGGPGDFIRINPDGTATLQINSNEADAFYTDQTSFPFKMFEGSGHLQMHHTGMLTIGEILPDGTILYFVLPGSHGAVVWHGLGKVIDINSAGPEFTLKAEYRQAGNGKITKNSLLLK